jgi:hypothetical protein
LCHLSGVVCDGGRWDVRKKKGASERALIYPNPIPRAKESINDSCAKSGVANTWNILW